MQLESKVPAGPLEAKWDRHQFELKLVNPANKRKFDIIVVGTGLAGGAASASLAELGYNVKTFCIQDSPRRAHSIALLLPMCSDGQSSCGSGSCSGRNEVSAIHGLTLQGEVTEHFSAMVGPNPMTSELYARLSAKCAATMGRYSGVDRCQKLSPLIVCALLAPTEVPAIAEGAWAAFCSRAASVACLLTFFAVAGIVLWLRAGTKAALPKLNKESSTSPDYLRPLT